MNFVLDGGVFRGQAESVPAHRMQNIESSHALVAGDDIANSVIADMADMDFAGRVGEHLQQIIFLFVFVFRDFKSFFLFPLCLPLFFNLLRFVLHYLVLPKRLNNRRVI